MTLKLLKKNLICILKTIYNPLEQENKIGINGQMASSISTKNLNENIKLKFTMQYIKLILELKI